MTSMLKGLAILPVSVGSISIGGVRESNGKDIPVMYDYITLETNVKKPDGTWKPHPAHSILTEEAAQSQSIEEADVKLRSIPVRILFDKPGNNISAEYSCFSDKGRQLCVGHGEVATRRFTSETSESVPEDQRKEAELNGVFSVACPGSENCSFGKKNRCRQYARAMFAVDVDGMYEKDPLSGFTFRTTSYNSIRTLTARFEQYAAVTGGKMAGMPMNLVMRAKSSVASYNRPVYYLDLVPRESLVGSMLEAAKLHADGEANGFQREALEQAVENGLKMSQFSELDEDGSEVVREFFNDPNQLPEVPKTSVEGNVVDEDVGF